ncbi:MAG: 8-oxo-dGTP diphosphatase [Deltaproteobacteria bacterium]|nr:8-oxo-dGTP diphosphatase [Deltaproteobacteria bacterium]
MFDSVQAIDWDTWKAVDVATLLFVIKDGRVLLIRKKRGLGAGKINAPGGRLDPGETAAQAAVREVQEELIVTPTGIQEMGVHRFQFVDGYSLHVHVYTATDFKGTPTETDEAIPLWFDVDAIPFEEMWADDVLWVPLMLRDVWFDGRWIFDGEAIVDYVLQEGRA